MVLEPRGFDEPRDHRSWGHVVLIALDINVKGVCGRSQIVISNLPVKHLAEKCCLAFVQLFHHKTSLLSGKDLMAMFLHRFSFAIVAVV